MEEHDGNAAENHIVPGRDDKARGPFQRPQRLRWRAARQQDGGLRAYSLQRHRISAAQRRRWRIDVAGRRPGGRARRHQNQRGIQSRLLPGQAGPHNHDTNETFIPMTGRWRASWENENGEVEYVDLNPLDVVSFPPGMIRRFENITEGDPNEESILMFVIGGDAPRAEFTDQAMQELDAAGVW